MALLGCGSAQHPTQSRPVEAGGPSSRIEERSLSDRPPLSVIERQGDPEVAIAFASLAAAAPDLHAALGEVLSLRLSRAGFPTQLVAHGLGFELILLAENPERARLATQALLQALSRPLTTAELAAVPAPSETEQAAPSAVAQCSAELPNRRRITDAAELDRERIATFARDRAAVAVVGDEDAAAAVGNALAAGPDWPELGRVRSSLAERDVTEVLRGRATLSVAVTVANADRALSAAASLGDPKSALGARLAGLGSGLRLRRVVATAHPVGACLRIDSDVDASPLPDARRLGFAIQLIEEEAGLSLAKASDENRLEATALSATDPRLAARAAAYGALLEPASTELGARLVALSAPDEAPLVPSIEAAIEQARAEAPVLEQRLRVESGQPGMWALVTTPCAAVNERAENAGHAAVLFSAAAAGATRGVRLEPWVGAEGLGLLGFAERAPGESDAEAAARLGDALGQALLAPPSALEVATARADLLKAAGSEPHPLLDGLLEALAPSHFGALVPRGSATSLQSASREAVLARQRELLRSPHRLAILSPTSAGDAAVVTRSLSRWLKTPDARRAAPCDSELAAPVRGELSLPPGSTAEGSYLGFRVPAKAGAELNLLAELLNQPGGALARTLAEPDLAGAARALVFGTSSARALVVQISAFEGREQEALSRVQKLFERLASGGGLIQAELEAAIAKQRSARRLAALDPRYRLVQLLEPGPPAPVDAAALRRLTASLRPEAAVVARQSARQLPPSSGKTPTSR
ncbi:MAG TPA: hypothetical protein VHP33_17645 [Polyangiaceae bacterium]|nr:hypothetical protein [Polyangiaceae bacterium]